MIIMSTEATTEQIASVVARVEAEGLNAHLSHGEERTVIGVVGDIRRINREQFLLHAWRRPHRAHLAALQAHLARVHPGGFGLPDRWGDRLAGKDLVIIAGPCSVEDRIQLLETAHAVREAGAQALRGGAYKPRTSPYAFQGLGEEGPGAAGRSPRGDRAADRHRGDVAGAGAAGGEIRGCAANWGAQHAELMPCCTPPGRASTRCCSSAACRPPSKNCSWRPNTSSRTATAG